MAPVERAVWYTAKPSVQNRKTPRSETNTNSCTFPWGMASSTITLPSANATPGAMSIARFFTSKKSQTISHRGTNTPAPVRIMPYGCPTR